MHRNRSNEKSNRNKARTIAIGFFTILSLVIVFLSFSVKNGVAGCAGDCISCHPVLRGDVDHKSLETCPLCHNDDKKKLELFAIPKNLEGGCGTKCFDCHQEWPKNGYHAALDTCKNCHDYEY